MSQTPRAPRTRRPDAAGATQPATTPPATQPETTQPATPRPARRTPRRRRRPADPAGAWARTLNRTRPGLLPFTLDRLATLYGRPTWTRRLDPTSELVLTILSQNSADINAERAFEALRAAYPPPPESAAIAGHRADPRERADGWGGKGIESGAAPDWAAVEHAPPEELIDVIRPGGLAPQKAPRIQASIREATGGYSLEFLGEMPALEAREWLTRIPGIGKKTASVILLFCFGLPLMPVDRHVERVSHRIGLIPPKATADDAHDLYLALLASDPALGPGRAYETHVNLIRHGRQLCHARRPDCEACPVGPRCRFVDRRAP
jgi:endonuclease III